jgi:magnesium transporter
MQDFKAKIKDAVIDYIRTDYIALPESITLQEAVRQLRSLNKVNQISYIYAVDEQERLTGVVQTRDLIMADPDKTLQEVMIKRVISIPDDATVFDACEFFVLYKLMAYPVVNAERKVIGVIDITMITDELLDFAERQNVDDVFESIGFRIHEVRNAGVFKAWRIRFPWMLSTIASGMACALVAGLFEATLAQSIALSFFLTLVLGLGESLSVQAMTLTIQRLHVQRPTRKWLFAMLTKELKVTALIATASALLVMSIVQLWLAVPATAAVVGGSILLSLTSASILGIVVPSVLHAFQMDPKVSSGPLTLALTDVFTIATYLTLGTFFL